MKFKLLLLQRFIFQFLLSVTLSTCVLVGSSTEYDVAGNGKDDALTDGLLVLRHEFGLEGAALTSGALAQDAAVTSPDAIASYINQRTARFDWLKPRQRISLYANRKAPWLIAHHQVSQ